MSDYDDWMNDPATTQADRDKYTLQNATAGREYSDCPDGEALVDVHRDALALIRAEHQETVDGNTDADTIVRCSGNIRWLARTLAMMYVRDVEDITTEWLDDYQAMLRERCR